MREFRKSGSVGAPGEQSPGATRRMDSEGRIRHSRYRTALGSTNECIAALDAGCALGYLATVPEDAADGLQHVRATLLKLVMRN